MKFAPFASSEQRCYNELYRVNIDYQPR